MTDPTPIRQHRRYPTRTKARAVGVAMVEGVTEAERQTGIPKTTIQEWTKRPEYVQLRTTAREVVVESLWVGIQVGIRELVDGIKGDAPLNHKAAAFEAMAERFALLNGEATSRTETTSMTGGLKDEERQKLRDFIDALPAELEAITE